MRRKRPKNTLTRMVAITEVCTIQTAQPMRMEPGTNTPRCSSQLNRPSTVMQ
ncbi:hypothetical protein FQZ97_854510 [compost metagenome]